ncbi:SEC-C metal-binding domain-containing protein [Paenibacillus sp. MMS20-IR301]|uniref:SEC-C metal-binding domain-containing protein n=1 Tax=Paenibacillus sp. MMS20-IR301 TaxID=2895946 RepID=UPI0028EECB8D|nr:SEC-C metal-binding domain-containing protein [Paenibacillus sp. MMS20-IR301]WNS41605.1 SEC-C metal-binding domain-containing protein [Paenibacillus sp. MMS20-IR301]
MIKVGRNEACPCGSGKKYKKCCLDKEKSATQSILRLVHAEDAAAQEVIPAQPAPEADVPAVSKLTLPKLKKMVSSELQWEHAAHQQLALQLIESMRSQYDRELILEALVLWNGYSRRTKPAVKKAGSFCAAIEYLLSEEYGFMLTQAELAEKYEITTATLSRKVKELYNYVEEYGMAGEGDELVSVQGQGTPREQAALLLHKAAEAASPKRRVQLAEMALELYPDSSDAYLVLAEESENEHEARKFLRAGMAAGGRELGEAFFTENKGYFWGLHETRPYILVCKSYAESCWFGGNAQEAVQTLEHILELNPEDNTGARYLLAAVYLYNNQLNEAERMIKHYEAEEAAAAFAYDKIVLEYKKSGITSQLKMLYRVARGVNKHVPDYLLGVKRLPHNLPDFVGMGDSNEAIEYVIMHSRLWASMPDLLKWMMKQ